MQSICYLLAVLAGASVATQQVLNASLRSQLGSPWWAGAVSYLVGLLVMVALALCAPGPRFMEVVTRANAGLPWSGGVFGAAFVGIGILMVPRLGAAMTISLIVVGQMICSLLIDHFGLLGVPAHPVTVWRLAGAFCLALGVGLVRA